MGYLTRHMLETKPANVRAEFIEEFLREFDGDYGEDIFEGDQEKAYRLTADLCEFSKKKKRKDVLIIVEGEGEDQPDMRREYFKNGKFYRVEPEIIRPEFDESLLE